MASKKNIVVVGGGSGGSLVAKTLAGKIPSAQVTLINPVDYLVSRPTLPRMTVSDQNDLLETALVPFDKLFTTPNGKFVKGLVETIQANEKGGNVVLTDGQQIAYDFLVLAPGSIWEGPLDIPEDAAGAKAFVAQQRAAFSKASKIVLVGGGAVGIEFAGEIKDIWPTKEVTIVHGEKGLLNSTYTASFRNGMEKGLHARGINIILDDFVDDIPTDGSPVKTRKGHSIEADLVVSTRGPRPRTAFIAQSLGEDVLDKRGQIKVQPTLQLIGHSNIFALGDAIDYVEQKQVMKAMAHSGIVTANIVALASGSTKLKPYKGSTEMIIVTNGKNGGRAYIGMLWGIVLGDWFARMIKSKTLLVPMTRGNMGY
ncbi:FAD/NAD(P)-binding domain-containing protein [Mycena indigotica]|uniref:FAD/NAD(P)-binding domain-containing protein n=1 Tax=Mycena indigotica TaxID=2126181 RepID=A0A8H6SYE8_9AGAR|nr:FAD/NAD(P)-binding domain-containing protein [Mycena indigotica]KAF7307072.1 FAD/NAD(P)-binding domain-containing protein [Mycena indigotica]